MFIEFLFYPEQVQTKNNQLQKVIDDVRYLNEVLKSPEIIQPDRETKVRQYMEINNIFYGDKDLVTQTITTFNSFIGLQTKEYSKDEGPGAAGLTLDKLKILWEILTQSNLNIMDFLRVYGSEGWEVISVRDYIDNKLGNKDEDVDKYYRAKTTYTLKRED